MQIRQRQWTVERLFKERESIDLNPAWQRGPAWKKSRQVLLIDSILRGMDIPKVYLRKLPAGNTHAYDAVDGQQRLRAIWEFKAGLIRLDYLEELKPIDSHEVAGRTYATIHKDLRARFNRFGVSVGEIVKATQDEIRNLFSRLQMGVSLNPAELRNAIGGPMRHVIDAIATSHEFFLDCRISDERYKRQDYATHAFAMAAYGGTRDIKAPELRHMVIDYGPDRSEEVLKLSADVGDTLNVLTKVNQLVGNRIVQKWIFVDLCFLIMQRHKAGSVVDPEKLYRAYHSFDLLRRQHTADPGELVRGKRMNKILDRHLYDYLQAFRAQGALSSNLLTRAAALAAFCPDIDART
jgi:hypothetical protein